MTKNTIIIIFLLISACGAVNANNRSSSSSEAENNGAALNSIMSELQKMAKPRDTPDEELESFIAFRNKKAEATCYLDKDTRRWSMSPAGQADRKLRESYYIFFSGKALRGEEPNPEISLKDCLKSAEKLSLDIKDVKIETPTRAVIVANITNITPIPEGAVVDDYDKKRREEGEIFKYQLEKAESGWTIAQIYDTSIIDRLNWKPKYSDEHKPIVPSFVWPT